MPRARSTLCFNFVSLAVEGNSTLRNPIGNGGMLHSEVARMKLPSLTTQKRETRVDGDAGNGPSKKPRNEGGDVESGILSDVAILEALKRARYTIPDKVDGFELLLPVRVSVP